MPRLHKIVTRHSQHASGPVSLIWWRRVHAQTAGRTGRTAHQSPIQLRCEQRAAYVSPGPLMPPGFLLQIAFLKLYLKTSKNTVLPAVLRKPWAASLDASVSLFPVGLRKGNRATYPRQITVRGLQWFASSESVKEISNSNLKMCPWLFLWFRFRKSGKIALMGSRSGPRWIINWAQEKPFHDQQSQVHRENSWAQINCQWPVATSTSLVWFVGVVVCWYGFLGL